MAVSPAPNPSGEVCSGWKLKKRGGTELVYAAFPQISEGVFNFQNIIPAYYNNIKER